MAGLEYGRVAGLEYGVDARMRVLEVALRRAEPDLVIRNCRVLCVHTGEAIATNLVIAAGRIAGWDDVITSGRQVLEADGLWAVSGLLDGHMHIEASMLTLGELARLLVPRGVTGIMADLHEVAHIYGRRGVEAVAREAAGIPLRVFLQLPAVLGVADVTDMLQDVHTVSVGEASLPRVLRQPDKFTALYAAAQRAGRIITGHAAGLRLGPKLAALAALGQADDHECETAAEALDRVRVGQRVMIREGSAARNLKAIVPVLLERPELADRFMLCTDDRHVTDILERGHMDDCVRMAVAAGVPPETAIRLATLSCAEHHRLDAEIGSLAPGRLADVVLVADLRTFQPERVLIGGRLVAERGQALWPRTPADYPEDFGRSIRLGRAVVPSDFVLPLPAGESTARIIRVTAGSIIKEVDQEPVWIEDGQVRDAREHDIQKIIVVERHQATGKIGVGLVRGFGLHHGALASSVAHDDHNIVATGVDDEDIAAAVQAIEQANGGLVAVAEGQVRALVPLAIAGLMSTAPAAEVACQLAAAEQAAREQGCTLPAPFMALAFVPLLGLPRIALSENGLLDPATQQPLSLQVC